MATSEEGTGKQSPSRTQHPLPGGKLCAWWGKHSHVLDGEARGFSSRMTPLSTEEVRHLFASDQFYRLMTKADSYQALDSRLGGFVS